MSANLSGKLETEDCVILGNDPKTKPKPYKTEISEEDSTRKKMYHAFRSMVVRYREKGKSDDVAIASWAYEKGLPKSEVEELYTFLSCAGKI